MTKLEWLKERHRYWWDFLLEKHPDLDPELSTCVPEAKLKIRTSNVAGRANNYRCSYNLNYLYTNSRESFDETICHEVCHAFQRRVYKDYNPHGPVWKKLFNGMCNQSRGKYHSYNDVHTHSHRHQQIKKLFYLRKAIHKLEDEIYDLERLEDDNIDC